MTTIYRQPGDPDFASTLLVLIATFGLVDLDRQHDAGGAGRSQRSGREGHCLRDPDRERE